MINELPDKLKNDIIDYCKLNKIDDIDSFIIKMITQSLIIEKYGRVPKIFENTSEKIVEKEVIPIHHKEEIKIDDLSDSVVEILEDKIKNEYEIKLDLNKKIEQPEIKEPPKIIEEDIYGEGKGGWFGGSNLYDILKKKK